MGGKLFLWIKMYSTSLSYNEQTCVGNCTDMHFCTAKYHRVERCRCVCGVFLDMLKAQHDWKFWISSDSKDHHKFMFECEHDPRLSESRKREAKVNFNFSSCLLGRNLRWFAREMSRVCQKIPANCYKYTTIFGLTCLSDDIQMDLLSQLFSLRLFTLICVTHLSAVSFGVY